MDLYLLRHGVAEEGGQHSSDAQRALTSDGRRELRQVLLAAREAKVTPSIILASPLKRTMQTAELAVDVLDFRDKVLQTPALQPGTTAEQVWDEIRVYKAEPSLLLVGHNPTLSQLAAFLLGSPGLQVHFKKGSMMKIEVSPLLASPRGILHWHITAKLICHRD